ncbi:hypothetical protein SAMN04489801_5912 [Pseudomonas mandelii]|uniref:Uncharacterized protein n=1 Tax=Pseudomonas mandelii TaxID=75612 RepID=A0ABY0W1I6_9PSED|nr:hypothetical protein SAMN04489801_5912 [Pseudomonas mandelii]
MGVDKKLSKNSSVDEILDAKRIGRDKRLFAFKGVADF